MRRLKNDCLSTMRSPIRLVMSHLHEAITNIAPERTPRFEKEHPSLSIEYIDTNRIICQVDTSGRQLRLSRVVVEFLWAVSYSYYVYYKKTAEGKMIVDRQSVDLTRDLELAQAMKLLKWAYESILSPTSMTSWPLDLPHPIENPSPGTYESVADELSLSAVASILHHELAHIRLNHRSPCTIDEEREADYEMADWILDNHLDLCGIPFIKRALGIAIGFASLTVYGIYSGNFDGKSHPLHYNRLLNTLSRHIADPGHVVWGFVACILKLHLDNKNIWTPEVIYNDFLDCINDYIDILSRHYRE